MSIDIEKVGLGLVKKQFKEAVAFAEQTMRQNAPYPTGRESGKGSYATGETKRGIHTEWHGDSAAFVGVENDHAHFADKGRGAISKKKAMVWYDKRGRKHVAYQVKAMEGWHFVEKTKEAVIAKYGGK